MASVIGIGSASNHRAVGSVRRRNGGEFGESDFSLGRLIESEVIPRLLVAHSEPLPAAMDGPTTISADEVERFAPLVLTSGAHEVLDVVETYLRRGVTIETLFVELLAPAARKLGEGWEDDRLDFIEVTMGLWRLQEVLREVAAHSPPAIDPTRMRRSALFAAMPGDQHGFGAAMVEQCFARAGWDTGLLVEAGRRELLGAVAQRNWDLIGLTVSRDCLIHRLPSLVTAVRSVSQNPQIRVMLGGRVLTNNPGLVAFAGADGTAPTATAAILTAEALFETMPCAMSA